MLPTDPSQRDSPSLSDSSAEFPWPKDRIGEYTAYRVDTAPDIDGHLDEASWQVAPQTRRFVDLVSGEPAIHDTRVAALWDDHNLYVGFWVEEPFVEATQTVRASLIYNDNDVEVFIAGRDAYYEFEINALGTIYEVFFVWEDAYEAGRFASSPEFGKAAPGARPWNGVGYSEHPRGARFGFWEWDFPGLVSAVAIDGTLNDNTDRDRGWSVELAFPWEGMSWLAAADGRSMPPRDGDTWRMSFSRFNQYREAPPAKDSSGWTMSPHGVWDSHIPELFPYIHFSTQSVTSIDQEV